MQVADRRHIIHSLADALARMAVCVLARLHKHRADEVRLEPKPPAAAGLSQSRIESRNELRHAKVHSLRSRGMNITAMAEQPRLNRTTVRKSSMSPRPLICGDDDEA
jgi:hypothetical protein